MSNQNDTVEGTLPVHRLSFEKPRLGLKHMAELTLLLPVEERGLHSIRVQAPREIMAELLWTLETFSVRHQYGTYSSEQPLGAIELFLKTRSLLSWTLISMDRKNWRIP